MHIDQQKTKLILKVFKKYYALVEMKFNRVFKIKQLLAQDGKYCLYIAIMIKKD